MNIIKFFLFGKFRIEADANLLHKFEPQKAKELLVYLLLYREQPQSREHLADALWRELAPEQSKAYLRKALWQLQTILESCGGQGMLLVDGEWLQINQDFDFWLDIEIVEKIFKNTQGVRGKDLEKEQARSIQEAVNTYRGNLLEGWYQDWCLYERERLQFLYLAMLDKLMDYCESHEAYEKGLLFGERILQYDRARERTYRRLMRLHHLAGDRTAALRQYQRCVAALKEELDVGPADRTRLLYEKIRADKLEAPAQPNRVNNERYQPRGKPRTPSSAASGGVLNPEGNKKSNDTEEPLSMLFSHLNTLHQSLSQIQTQLGDDLKVIQKTLERN